MVMVICIVQCIPYGPRDRDIETHHTRDSSTSIQRVDTNRRHGDWNNNGNRQWGEVNGRDRNEGTGRGHTSISRDSPYRY